MKYTLQKARRFEKTHPLSPDERPLYHLTGSVGWINDPNGFAPYRGEYHLFFQYYPYDVKWGTMHWGHAKTRDFIRWEQLPAALAPEESYDNYGCFSGGAVELPDGRHLLLYTGLRKELVNGRRVVTQSQCAAYGDGLDYRKVEGNPVIDRSLLPPGGSPIDFRDPKLWIEDGKLWAVMGNRCEDGSGAVLLFVSEDWGLHWRCRSTLARCRNRYGTMWECPDFFRLDGKAVLITSPQEMRAQGLEFHPGNANICLIGQLDPDRLELREERVQAVDYGLDFYAPQTLLTEDGRRVLIGWMQNWESCQARRPDLHFFGQMTVPRELRIENGRLCQLPVRELERYRGSGVRYRGYLLQGETALDGISGRCLDLTLRLRSAEAGRAMGDFTLSVAVGEGCFTSIRYDAAASLLCLDRTWSGFPSDTSHVRRFPVSLRDGALTLRVLLDRWSMELFVNGGEQAASCVLYTDQTAGGIRFAADAPLLLDADAYPLLFPTP